MKVEIKLYAPLSVGRFQAEIHEYATGSSVEQAIQGLEFAGGDVGIILINGKHGTIRDTLHDGDVLSLLPLMDGG